MQVRYADGRPAGLVSDVRVLAAAGTSGYADLSVEGLVLTPRRTGSLLGYDRRREQGPWLVRVIVARLHRRAGYVAWSDVREVDWENGRILLDTDTMSELTEA